MSKFLPSVQLKFDSISYENQALQTVGSLKDTTPKSTIVLEILGLEDDFRKSVGPFVKMVVLNWLHHARLVVPHLALIAATSIYTLLGATAFYYIERPYEFEHRLFHQRRIRDAQVCFLSVFMRFCIFTYVHP